MKLRTLLLIDMSLNNGQITESVSNTSYTVVSQLPACTIASPSGDALRFDGYSNYVKAGLSASTISTETMTLSVTLAAESYPMMKVDVAEETPTFATICGNLDEAGKKGFLFRTTDAIKADYPHIPAFEDYNDLLAAIKEAL